MSMLVGRHESPAPASPARRARGAVTRLRERPVPQSPPAGAIVLRVETVIALSGYWWYRVQEAL